MQSFNKVNKKFREDFLEEHGYYRCEMCGISSSTHYETHHIIYRSEVGKSSDTHNTRNLILLCPLCHKKLHDKKSLRNGLVKARKLNDLYKRNFYIKEKVL